MRRFTTALLALFIGTGATGVRAQDVLGSTNSVTRSYNYFEVQYLPDSPASPPLLASLVMDISDAWSLKAEYLKQDYDNIGALLELQDGLDVDADAEALSVGVLYHQPFTAIENSDWVAGLSIGRTRVTVSALGIDGKSASNFQEGFLGIRRTLSRKLEGEVGINVFRDQVDGKVDYSGDLRLVYRVVPSIDIAVAMNEIGETDLLGIGFRYTWQ